MKRKVIVQYSPLGKATNESYVQNHLWMSHAQRGATLTRLVPSVTTGTALYTGQSQLPDWKNTDSLNSCWFLCCRRCIHPILQICGWSPSCRISNPGFPLGNILSSLESPSHLPGRQPSPSRIDNRSPQPSLNLRGDHTLTRFTKATTFSNSCWAWQALSHPLQLKPFQSSKIFRDHQKWSNSMKPCVCVTLLASAVDRTVAGGTWQKYEVPAWFASGKKECKVEETACFFLLLQITTILLDTYPVKTCEKFRWQY